jgi:hypothetical protein
MLVIGPSEGGSRPWSLLESHLPTLSGGAGGTISGVSECDTNYIHNICHILRAYDNISCIVDKKPWSALEYSDGGVSLSSSWWRTILCRHVVRARRTELSRVSLR